MVPNRDNWNLDYLREPLLELRKAIPAALSIILTLQDINYIMSNVVTESSENNPTNQTSGPDVQTSYRPAQILFLANYTVEDIEPFESPRRDQSG